MHHLKGYFSLFRFDDPIEIIYEMYHLINTVRKILEQEIYTEKALAFRIMN